MLKDCDLPLYKPMVAIDFKKNILYATVRVKAGEILGEPELAATKDISWDGGKNLTLYKIPITVAKEETDEFQCVSIAVKQIESEGKLTGDTAGFGVYVETSGSIETKSDDDDDDGTVTIWEDVP